MITLRSTHVEGHVYAIEDVRDGAIFADSLNKNAELVKAEVARLNLRENNRARP